MSDTEKKATGDAEIIGARNVHKLLKNVKLRDDWLYLPGTEIPHDAVPIPAGIGTQLYVKREIDGTEGEGLKSFYEFALFNLDAASVGTGSSASGGQSEGRVTTPLERVSVPVGGRDRHCPSEQTSQGFDPVRHGLGERPLFAHSCHCVVIGEGPESAQS